MTTQRAFLDYIDRHGVAPAPVIARALRSSTAAVHAVAKRLAIELPAAPRGSSARLAKLEARLEVLERVLLRIGGEDVAREVANAARR